MAVGTRMLQRRALEADWNVSAYVLAEGEIGVTLDTGIIKIGDGVNSWSELPNAFDSQYLPLLGTAANSNLLDGMDSTLFAKAEDVPTTEVMDAAIDAAIDTARLTIHNRVVTDTNFTLQATDAGKVIMVTNSNYTPDLTCTIPANATAALPVGFTVHVASISKGAVKFVGEAGVFLRGNPVLYGANSVVELVKTSTTDWLILVRTNSSNPALRRYVTDASSMAAATFVTLPLAGVDTTFDTPSKAYDSLGDQWVSGTPDRVFCRRDGYYDINAQVHITGSGAGRMYCMLAVNGVNQNVGRAVATGTSNPVGASVHVKLPLKVNDYVQLIGYQDTGTGRVTASVTNASSFFQWEWSRPL